jgi:hypothetical protein
MLPSHLVAYLADTVFEPMEEIARRAERWGVRAVVAEGQVTLTPGWQGGIVGALAESTDPIGRAVVLAFVLFGQFWPQLAPDLLDQVNRRWHARRAGELGVKYLP